MRTRQSTSLRHTVDRLIESPTHYWVVMVSDGVWALAFLVVGWAHYTGPVAVAIAAGVAGSLGWGLFEYFIHRWVLHGAPSFARRSHARHHGDVHALISTPFLVIAVGALAMRVLLGLVLPSGLATMTVFGLYAGYNYFALLHHLQHHRGAMIARVVPWRTLVTLHDGHHRRPHVNYGITTTFWDRVFGTYDPTTRRPGSRGSHSVRPTRLTGRTHSRCAATARALSQAVDATAETSARRARRIRMPMRRFTKLTHGLLRKAGKPRATLAL